MARQVRSGGEARHAFERALDWLADGVVLVASDSGVIYANAAFQAIARANDGIRARKGSGGISIPDARFDTALDAARRLRDGKASTDFPVARPSGAPSYLVSVRPLRAHRHDAGLQADADAIVLVRDPLSHSAAAIRILREVFGLTDAEASVAQALQSGVPLGDYARARAVSPNTVYTHLRRIKEKTGCSRMAELIRRLNDLQVPLRSD